MVIVVYLQLLWFDMNDRHSRLHVRGCSVTQGRRRFHSPTT